MKLLVFVDIMQVLKFEFLQFRILEILNFHPCIHDLPSSNTLSVPSTWIIGPFQLRALCWALFQSLTFLVSLVFYHSEEYNHKSAHEGTLVLRAPGEIVVAQFQQDKQWYRARVLQATEEMVKVFSHFSTQDWQYSKTCVKWPLKNRQNKGLNDNW